MERERERERERKRGRERKLIYDESSAIFYRLVRITTSSSLTASQALVTPDAGCTYS
jgi:hypothetical protein